MDQNQDQNQDQDQDQRRSHENHGKVTGDLTNITHIALQ